MSATHEVWLRPHGLDRILAERQTTLQLLHEPKFQVGDTLRLVDDSRRADVSVTHVLLGLHADDVAVDCCVLSVDLIDGPTSEVEGGEDRA